MGQYTINDKDSQVLDIQVLVFITCLQVHVPVAWYAKVSKCNTLWTAQQQNFVSLTVVIKW